MTEPKNTHAQISYLAHYDSLTGLVNRATLKTRVDEALLIAEKQHKRLALCFIDIDGFKVINDHFGREKGDEVLKIVANNLKHCVRENDVVARLNADGFVVLLSGIKEKAHIIAIVKKIMQQLQQTVSDNIVSLSVTPSIGIAFYPNNGLDYEQLLSHAYKAMYVAKVRGRNQYAFFNG